MKYSYNIKKSDSAVEILLCGNKGVVQGMILTALSISARSKRRIKMFIGTMDLSDIDERYIPVTESDADVIREALKRGNPDSEVRLIDFGDMFRQELLGSKNMETSYTPYAMVRLFADKAEEIGDKVLYLDTDVMLLGDIGELYDVDIEGYEMAGALDYFGKVFISPRYMNSGVLLWNMKELRETGALYRARVMCRDKKMLLMDQSALNKCVRRKLYLPRRFNEQHDMLPDTFIRHFTMTIKWFPFFHTETVKPWHFDLVHEKLGITCFDQIFEDYKLLTAKKEITK